MSLSGLCSAAIAQPLLEHMTALRNSQTRRSRSSGPLLYQMFVLPLQAFLSMVRHRAHEELLAEDLLVEFDDSLGNVMFVSHQWAACKHPDPYSEQLRVLQDALLNLLSGQSKVVVSMTRELYVGQRPTLTSEDLKSRPLFVWYDYFCCPQSCVEHRQLAIDSIPVYVSRSKFFVILCPWICHSDHDTMLSQHSWARRGWCRMERLAFELTQPVGEVLMLEVRSAGHQFALGAMDKVLFPVGEGEFTEEADRPKMAQLTQQMVHDKLVQSLKDGKVHEYRMTFSMQKQYTAGLSIESCSLVPGFDDDAHRGTPTVLARFMHQTGFMDALAPDDAGWSPLCYAALGGDPELISSLLDQRADPDTRIVKASAMMMFPDSTPVLNIAALLRNDEAIAVLLRARADPNAQDGYLSAPLHWAAAANCVEGIRLLLAAGATTHKANMLGATPFDMATQFGYVAATEELVPFMSKKEIGAGLHQAARHDHADADLVWTLIEADADVDQQLTMPLLSPLGLMFSYYAVKHRWHHSILSNYAYHYEQATPLMCSILNCNFQVAAALIAGGARLDLQNARGKTALELSELMSVPEYLSDALAGKGDAYEDVCRRSRSEMSTMMGAVRTSTSRDESFSV